MKKIRVKVQALSYSQSQVGSYVAVLSETKGKKKIPVIVKPHDAQYIAIKLESFESSTPSIHDVVMSLTEMFSATVEEIIIDNFLEGLFYSRVCLVDIMGESHSIKCNVGDAITLSLAYGCPLFVMKNVMDIVGIELSDDGTVVNSEDSPDDEAEVEHVSKYEKISIPSLENMLKNALDTEDYELASQLRDKINSLKGDEKQN